MVYIISLSHNTIYQMEPFYYSDDENKKHEDDIQLKKKWKSQNYQED